MRTDTPGRSCTSVWWSTSERRTRSASRPEWSGRDRRRPRSRPSTSIGSAFTRAAEASASAEAAFDRLFVARELPEDVEEAVVQAGNSSHPPTVHLPELIADLFGGSRSEARRAIQGGGVKLDGEPVSELDLPASTLDGRVLQVGKREVGIKGVEPVGNYAIKPLYTDGHDTGIYTWDYLYKLGSEQDALWQDYLQRLQAAGFAGDSGREPGTVLPGAAAKPHACGHHH